MSSSNLFTVLMCASLLTVGCSHSQDSDNKQVAEPDKGQTMKLSANDVSILFPPPKTKEDMALQISLADLGNAMPDNVFANMEEAIHSPALQVEDLGIDIPNDEFKGFIRGKKTAWYVSAIRVDPSAPGVSDDIRKQFGTIPQIRLIMVPVTQDAETGKPVVHDFALHLIYNYTSGADTSVPNGCFPRPKPDREKFKSILADLTQLKMDLTEGKLGGVKINTEGDLGVYPALSNAQTRQATHERIKSFLNKHLPQGQFRAIAAMGVGVAGPDKWFFASMVVDPGTGKVIPVPSPALLQSAQTPQFTQMINLNVSQSSHDVVTVTPKSATNNLNPITCQSLSVPEGERKGVSTAELFEAAMQVSRIDMEVMKAEAEIERLKASLETSEDQEDKKIMSDQLLEFQAEEKRLQVIQEKLQVEAKKASERVRPVVDVIANPAQAHFFNTDCISCHTETRREMELLGVESFKGLASNVLPDRQWNLRNFGWFGESSVDTALPSATRRTMTETAEVVECVNDLDACFDRVK